MSEYSVEEVRAAIKDVQHASDDCYPSEAPANDLARAAAMLTAYAERIKADERVVPVAWVKPIRADDYGLEGSDVGDVVDVMFHCHSEKPDGEGWLPTFTHPPAQAAQGEVVNLGADAVRGVLSAYKRLAAFDADETAMRECLRVFLQKQPSAQPVAQGEMVAFKHPVAVRSAAAFLLAKFEHAPCDSSGVSCCVRCSAVAMSRWAIEALDSSVAVQPRAVPDVSAMVESARRRYSYIRGLNDECENDDLAWHEAIKAALAAAPSPGESA